MVEFSSFAVSGELGSFISGDDVALAVREFSLPFSPNSFDFVTRQLFFGIISFIMSSSYSEA